MTEKLIPATEASTAPQTGIAFYFIMGSFMFGEVRRVFEALVADWAYVTLFVPVCVADMSGL